MKLETKLLNFKLKSPLMAASGPLTSTSENILFFNEINAGALVTKTISSVGADVKKPCIYAEKDMVYNSELWSEDPPEKWINEFLPEIVKKKDKPLIVSVGYNIDDFNNLIPKLDKFADMFEISTHYIKSDLGEVVKTIRKNTDKPIFMKLSPHIQDYIGFTKTILDAGATGVVAINSVGPGIKIDLMNRRLQLGNEDGQVWVSGPAIKPYALQRVRDLRNNFKDIPIISAGGVNNATDVLEFLLAGADSVQMLSSALINGKSLYKKILGDLPLVLEKYNFNSIEEVKNAKLLERNEEDNDYPTIDFDKCKMCLRCVDVCPVFAWEYNDGQLKLNNEKCIKCGTCESRCPVFAISGVLYEI